VLRDLLVCGDQPVPAVHHKHHHLSRLPRRLRPRLSQSAVQLSVIDHVMIVRAMFQWPETLLRLRSPPHQQTRPQPTVLIASNLPKLVLPHLLSHFFNRTPMVLIPPRLIRLCLKRRSIHLKTPTRNTRRPQLPSLNTPTPWAIIISTRVVV